MNTEEGIIPLTALNPACQRFLDEKLDDPVAYQQRLDALTMVHTVMEFGACFQQSRQRKSAWFPRRSRRVEQPLCVHFHANAAGLVEFRNRMDLPLMLVWEAATALYGPEAVSPVEADGFTIRLYPW